MTSSAGQNSHSCEGDISLDSLLWGALGSQILPFPSSAAEPQLAGWAGKEVALPWHCSSVRCGGLRRTPSAGFRLPTCSSLCPARLVMCAWQPLASLPLEGSGASGHLGDAPWHGAPPPPLTRAQHLHWIALCHPVICPSDPPPPHSLSLPCYFLYTTFKW